MTSCLPAKHFRVTLNGVEVRHPALKVFLVLCVLGLMLGLFALVSLVLMTTSLLVAAFGAVAVVALGASAALMLVGQPLLRAAGCRGFIGHSTGSEGETVITISPNGALKKDNAKKRD